MVPRERIWKRMKALGIGGSILQAVHRLYEHPFSVVKLNGVVSQTRIVTHTGVKQGCPLSPLLFGLFIEELSAQLDRRAIELDLGVKVGERTISNAFYADDATLISPTMDGAQGLMSIVESFSDDACMQVNVPKTEQVVFKCKRATNPYIAQAPFNELRYKGETVKASLKFKYLGLYISAEEPWFTEGAEQMAASAYRALWAAWTKIQKLQVKKLKLKIDILESLATPIALYGCQVWGVDYLNCSNEDCIFGNPAQQVIFTFLRLITGGHRTVSRWNLLKECGMMPIQVKFACLCAKIWNDNIEAQGLVGNILRADVQLCVRGSDSCWSAKFLKCMSELNLMPGTHTYRTLRRENFVSASSFRFYDFDIREAFGLKYDKYNYVTPLDPRSCVSLGAIRVKYEQWFVDEQKKFLHLSAPTYFVQQLCRFRLCSTMLACYQHVIDRRDRTCILCDLEEMEDEKHLIFDCSAYAQLRTVPKWARLFDCIFGLDLPDSAKMNLFMNQDNQYDLSSFIFHILRMRKAKLDLFHQHEPDCESDNLSDTFSDHFLPTFNPRLDDFDSD